MDFRYPLLLLCTFHEVGSLLRQSVERNASIKIDLLVVRACHGVAVSYVCRDHPLLPVPISKMMRPPD